MNHKEILRAVVTDILNNDLRITQFIGDSPKRSMAKDVKGHSSWYPCKYCYCKGSKIEVNTNLAARKKL